MERGEGNGGGAILMYAQQANIIVCYCVVINSHGNYTVNSTGVDVGIVFGYSKGDLLPQPQSFSPHLMD